MVYTPPKYPGAIPTLEDLPNRQDDVDWLVAARYNELKKELRAALTELGVLPKGSDADVVTRLNRIQSELDAIPPPEPGEGRIYIFGRGYSAIGQGTWVLLEGPYGWSHFLWYNTSNANGDNISYKVFLAKGTYTVGLLHYRAINRGIVDIYIDATKVTSFDCYGAYLVNVFLTDAGNVVTTSGIKTIKLQINGKNPASSDYYFSSNFLILWRTA